ncbi:hypothetical protein EMCRGX_G033261 [Ephydatia muelleri]
MDIVGKELGRGAYSKVVELRFYGLKCAGKEIDQSVVSSQQRFAASVMLLGQLQHPNVTQFIGLFHRPGSELPLIVTEYLPFSVASCLARYSPLPEETTYGILRDVATALVYMHRRAPPVSHGSLTANNVLLTWDLRAKVSDAGLARNLGVRSELRSKHTLTYLPPECLDPSNTSLTPQTDCYSFGVLSIYTLGGRCPEGAGDEEANEEMSLTRRQTPGGLSRNHPLAGLLRQCLSVDPMSRPDSLEILGNINCLLVRFPADSLEHKSRILRRVLLAGSELDYMEALQQSPDHQGEVEAARLSLSVELEQSRLLGEELREEVRALRASLVKQQGLLAAMDQEMAAKLMAKDQEIATKCHELAARETDITMCKAAMATKEATVQGLGRQMRKLQGFLSTRNELHLLTPEARLTWKQCSYLPHAMVFGQAVTVRDRVYFGSGTANIGDAQTRESPYKIFCYSTAEDRWTPVADCPVIGFGMVEFMGELVLVGGAYENTDGETDSAPYTLTNHVFTLNGSTREWVKSLPSMPTPRLLPSVVRYKSSIVACGGLVLDSTSDFCVNTVELYHQDTGQWYVAEPLPLACIGMTSCIINDTCYLLGGFTDTEFDHPTQGVFSCCLPSLLEDTVPLGVKNGDAMNNGSSGDPVWQRFVDAPRFASTVAALGGCLLALGGSDENLEHKSGALHVFSPLTSSWVRIEDIPVECFACACTRLGTGEILLIGGMGHDDENALRTVYKGCLTMS